MPQLAQRQGGLLLFSPALAQGWGGLHLFSPALAQGRGGLHLAWTRSKARRTFSCLNSLNGEKDFFWPELAQRREWLFLAWTRSKARMTFSGASTCPGRTSPPPWMHWGLLICSCLHSLKVEEDFFLAWTHSEVKRTLSGLNSLKGEKDFFSFSPSLAHRRGGLLLFLACTRSRARRNFSCLKTHESVEVFTYNWCLRSPKDDEDFKTLTGAANRRKTMGTLKLFTDAANRRKTMGTLKLFTNAANRRKTMGTLNFYFESMQHNSELALNHVRVIRSFF